ncbi:acyl-binding domain-containing 4-like isoform X1 isoform A [Micractinium conductrix]|uniref:Acyl-binding domain-containing 4-like isoform X1 isoform A n=1 Tax=Micractinium conductrix TaxID=554055 RepID=A0A2P6V1I4_9CHLO|nr:acyl-binding domain-containing 4-like isoform X1 isoform A [Micractinium conductrix]|eukprot:PSC67948.1 acyl-binding domain-containing 4-like isoform X1 isoform A [Micractinium conductrix]
MHKLRSVLAGGRSRATAERQGSLEAGDSMNTASTGADTQEGETASSSADFAECPFLGHRYYLPVRRLFRTTLGQVYLARNKETGQEVVVKMLERGPAVTKHVESELLIHRKCTGHTNIVQLIEVFLTPRYLAIVLEYAPGGDLLEFVTQKGQLLEEEARWFFQQLTVGLAYLHSIGVDNRELNLSNKLLTGDEARPLLKINDFTYSKSEQINSDPNSALGSLPYTAPEVLSNTMRHGHQADVWSLGVALYKMCVGLYPFERQEDALDARTAVQNVLGRIARVEYGIPTSMSPELQDLLGRMLVKDPSQRISIPGIMAHPWFQSSLPQGLMDLNGRVDPTAARQSEEEIVSVVREAQASLRPIDTDNIEEMADDILAEEEADDLLEELSLTRDYASGSMQLFPRHDRLRMEDALSPKPGGSLAGCPLPYPDRFTEATAFIASHGDSLSEESKLLLYSLHQQATVGPCNEPKPWGWSVVNNAKWQSWKQLGDMPSVEAMRLYVRTLEEEVPAWWAQHTAGGAGAGADDTPAANGVPPPPAAAAADGDAAPSASAPAAAPPPPPPPVPAPKTRSVAEVVVEGSWVSPYISSDKRPPPRYEHATALIGSELYVVGGNYGGRYLNDTWALNLENLTWKAFVPSGAAKPVAEGTPRVPAALPAIAGHVAVPWEGSVVLVGGHMKAKEAQPDMPVRLLDTKAGTWSAVECGVAEEGEELPRPRGGHSGVLVGSKLFIFGGEDMMRRPLGELLVLDLATWQWSRPEASGTRPGPRSAHAAALYRNRYLLVFGGGSVAHCNNELHCLDTQTLEWSQPAWEGPVPPPRAGHAGAILGSTWFIVGGGNNTSGCADMYALDLSPLGSGPVQWTLVGNTPVESAIASEGLSLLPVPMAGCMISFGGYNGRYHNAVHVYRPEGYLATHVGAPQQHAAAGQAAAAPAAKAAPAANPAAAAQAAASSALAAAAAASAEIAKHRAELEAARREAAAAKEAVAHEVAIMRRQLESSQGAAAEAEKALEEARTALEAEQGRAMRLEVEVAEAQQALGRMEELERELQKYRLSAGEKKGSGIWGYISGSG